MKYALNKRDWKWKFVFTLLLLAFLGGCTSSSDDVASRVDVLYAHTLQMGDYSSPKLLQKIGLDLTKMSGKQNAKLATSEKLEEMETAYDVSGKGSFKERISFLEEKMGKMMIIWAEARAEAEG